MVAAKSTLTVAVPSGQSITVFTQDSADVYQVAGASRNLLGTASMGQQTFGSFPSGASIAIESGNLSAFFAIGVTPILTEFLGNKIQRAPVAINSAGTLPIGALFSGLINGSAGLLGVTGTLPTGAALDAAADFRPDDSFDWIIMSTGLGTFSIGASAGHTIVGAAGVGSAQSGAFRTRKAGPNVFVTYRIG
jgi:hypothetical protein